MEMNNNNPFRNNGTRPTFNNNNGRPRFRPDPQDTTTAPILLGVGGGLMAISMCLLAVRLWSRTRPFVRLSQDDWAVLAATILALTNYILLSLSVVHGLGRRTQFVSSSRRRESMFLLFLSQVFWVYAITLVKLSVAFLLLRVKRSSWKWRLLLHTIIILLIVSVIIQTCFLFLACNPFQIYWDPRVIFELGKMGRRVQCLPRKVITANVIGFSGIHVGVDLLFSFIPITFIRPLRLPRREKIFMCILMALGLFASAGAIMRTLQVQGYYNTQDHFRKNVNVALWAVVEMQFALIAATIPTLKSVVERVLVRVGLYFYKEQEEEIVRGKLVAFGLLDRDEEKVLEVDDRKIGKEARVLGLEFEMGGGKGGVREDERKSKRERKVRDEFDIEMLDSDGEGGDKDIEDMLERGEKVVEGGLGNGTEKEKGMD